MKTIDINKHEKLSGLGRKVRTFREAKGWSQRDMAANCNIDAADIGRIERGQVDVRYTTIIQLAKVLDVTPCELFDC
jgi:transcriptional regulator with XRE-family HTH domain